MFILGTPAEKAKAQEKMLKNPWKKNPVGYPRSRECCAVLEKKAKDSGTRDDCEWKRWESLGECEIVFFPPSW